MKPRRRRPEAEDKKKAKTAKYLRLDDDKKPRRLRRKAKKVKEPEAEINGTKMVYDKIHLPSLQIMTTNKEAMKATIKKPRRQEVREAAKRKPRW